MSEESNPIIGYADSYRQMARTGTTSIDIWSIITDLERNMAPIMAAAQSELAALREELAELADIKAYATIPLRDRCAERKDLQQRLTATEQRNAALVQQASQAFESAARWVESRRDEYVNDHGSLDLETGTVEFPGNGEEYVGELDEIAEGLRSLKPTESGASDKCLSDGGTCGLGGTCHMCPHKESGASE